MLNTKSILGLSALLIAGVANTNDPANAGLNTDPSIGRGSFGDAAGTINAISTFYDSSTQEFNWYSNHSSMADGAVANAFWLVVSDGPNPKGISGQLAAIYFDASKAGTPKVSVYGYNGVNGSSSWYDGASDAGTQSAVKIANSLTAGLVNNAFSTVEANGTTTLGMSLNVSGINSKVGNGFEGINFTDNLGIWFHPVTCTDSAYDAQGFLTKFDFRDQGWFDIAGGKTAPKGAPVPEPASIAAIGLGIAAMVRRKRSK
jgi:hypothetical protein